jgi:2-hydroxy-3-oxopropionate reductase
MSEEKRIGLIGLGVMGLPMARNLLAAGYELVVANRTVKKAEALATEGAIVAATPSEVAAATEVVITMLPDSPDVRDVVLGPAGVLEGGRPGQLIIDVSTISPVVAQKIDEAARARGLRTLDAPVSGGDVGAREGTLSIMVGGEADDVDRARPLLDVLGSSVTHMGPSGAGQVTKACNQIVVALTIAALSEAIVLGAQAGVDAARLLDALRGGLAGSRVIETKGHKLVGHDFAPGFRVELHYKDLGLALEAARRYGVVLPLTATADQLFAALCRLGMGEADHTAMLAMAERLSNVAATGEPYPSEEDTHG